MPTGAKSLLLLVAVCGCSSTSSIEAGRLDYGFDGESNLVWVRGPWEAIRPSHDIDEVIDQLCPAVMTLPRATHRDYGQEYCGAIYTLADGMYYASVGSPLGRTELVGPSKRKTCYSPNSVKDPRGEALPGADYHSHPWVPSPMTSQDRSLETQRWQIRIQFDTGCHIQKLISHKYSSLPGELYERQGRSWRLIGRILPEDKKTGRITAVDE
jgi:hypothetical protein